MSAPAPSPTPNDRLGDQLARRFRFLYIGALTLIALAAVAGQVVVQRAIAARERDARIVNLSGRQRMLSQRLVLHAWAWARSQAAGNEAEAARTAAVMDDVLREWSEAHATLRASVEQHLPRRSALVDALFDRMAAPMSRLEEDARRLRDPVRAAELTERLNRMLADQDDFLASMDAEVNALELHFTEYLGRLRQLEFVLFVITVVVLILEAWLVFRPLAARLRQAVNALADQEQRVEKRLESLRYLAGGVAHNYNNLLTSIGGNAELIRLEAARNEVVARLAEAQSFECARAAKLTAQLLAYSGHGDYRFKPVVLSEVVQNAVQRFPLGFRNRLEVAIAEDCVVEADSTHLVDALYGILANAHEATEVNRGAIRVALRREQLTTVRCMSGAYRTELAPGIYARIEVLDEGTGLQAERVACIFDPFVSTKSPGRGLGLAAVLGVVHGHRGGVTVESQVGLGTTVRLYLPTFA